jgi:ribonuclease III family protein
MGTTGEAIPGQRNGTVIEPPVIEPAPEPVIEPASSSMLDSEPGSRLEAERAPGPAIPGLQVQQLSPASLAYLGDAVYELYIRRYYLVPPKRPQAYHHQVVAQVRAEAQAIHLQALTPHLSPAELDIVKRGRNAANRGPRRTDPDVYQQATSLEALIGYLHLTDPARLDQLLGYLSLT